MLLIDMNPQTKLLYGGFTGLVLLILISFIVNASSISCGGTTSPTVDENNSSTDNQNSDNDGSGGGNDDAEPPSNGALLNKSNFEYLGAFRLPRTTNNGSSFSYGGMAMAYRFDGDTGGENNKYPGSLFISGSTPNQMVAEVSIPEPLDPRNVGVSGLNTAGFLQNFTDVTAGRARELDTGTGFRIEGLAYLPKQGAQTESKLYWTARPYYNVSPDTQNPLSHGVSNADFGHLNSTGMWRLGSFHSSMTAGYIFTVPNYFASAYLGGRLLISGLFTSQGIQATSAGPAMFAYAPWQDDPTDGVPPNGTILNTLPLVYYPCHTNGSGCDSNFVNYKDPDLYQSAEWVNTETAHAVVVAGRRSGTNRYGPGRSGDCNYDSGYHGEPYTPTLILYNPENLASVASGSTDPTNLQPYSEWNPREYFVETCEWELSGLGYDRENRFLYILHRQADTVGGEPQPLIYVFRVN